MTIVNVEGITVFGLFLRPTAPPRSGTSREASDLGAAGQPNSKPAPWRADHGRIRTFPPEHPGKFPGGAAAGGALAGRLAGGPGCHTNRGLRERRWRGGRQRPRRGPGGRRSPARLFDSARSILAVGRDLAGENGGLSRSEFAGRGLRRQTEPPRCANDRCRARSSCLRGGGSAYTQFPAVPLAGAIGAAVPEHAPPLRGFGRLPKLAQMRARCLSTPPHPRVALHASVIGGVVAHTA